MNTERPDHDPDHDPAQDDAVADEKPAAEADGTDDTAGTGSTDGTIESAPDESGAERPFRRRSPVLVASVAAAVLLVGGGGAYLATSVTSGSGDERTDTSAPGGDGTAPPPLALDGYTKGGTGDPSGSNGIAPGEPDPNGVTYRADGTLPAGPASAPVYSVAKDEIKAAEVTRLAEALGVEGKPVAEADSWLVGAAKDGTGPILRVSRQAPGTWSFSRYLAGGSDNCKSTTRCAQGSGAAGQTVDPVSEAVAKKAAAPILKAVGQDDAKLDASKVVDTRRAVNADPVVGGLPTYGWPTGLQISAQGEVVAGSGQLTTPVKGDTYPVLGAKATLALLNEPGAAASPEHRMGIGGCASPVPLKDRLEAPCGTTTGTARQKESLTVDKAVFGLASHSVSGRPALVPSWLFEVRPQGAAESYTVTYPAIDPRYLAGAGSDSGSGPSAEPSPTGGTLTQDVRIEGYTVSGDGKELTVGFWAGACSKYSASVKEDEADGGKGGQVRVTVTSTSEKGKACILIAKAGYETVRLNEPLGDRKVVGADGQAIPEGDFAKK
ncbi:hypothetical protein PV396_43200 [Streptomyces sp. ME02-8801-2C]|uniref:hypothetical protein n=1 Tax=Streptomyces sp. ME02-8801-2C TaxID=3028680 RepID=UPI0029A3F8EC|nr:hypothetical protein [Streptomyces sp. ME02-8801-2C]MDX3458659.1 hypothetical protein [Streptomyces sp. ME02-8801-2C]